VGLPQRRRDDGAEPPLLTLGDDARAVMAALSPDGRPYRAEDVVRHLLDGGVPRVGGSAVDAEALEVMSDPGGSVHRSVAAGGAEEELCL
jgi:hypothetical protein